MKVVRIVLVSLLYIAAYAQDQQTTVLHHVYLRSDPSTANAPIETLRKGQKVTFVDAAPTDGFFHIKTSKGKKGWIGATYLAAGMPEPTPEFAAKFSTAAGCDASLWDHVYKPERLTVKQQCITVTGTIVDATVNQSTKRKDGVRKEADGDTHGWLKLDPQFKNLINAGNVSDEESNLVFEIVCNFNVTQADAKASCPKTYHNDVKLSPVGSHVKIIGSYVQETNHAKWMEIHPVSSIEVMP
jgi:hypothetical protein